MFSRFLMAGSLVKHSDSHSYPTQRGSQLNLSLEKCSEDKSLFNSSTPVRTEAEINLMKSIRASACLFLILGYNFTGNLLEFISTFFHVFVLEPKNNRKIKLKDVTHKNLRNYLICFKLSVTIHDRQNKAWMGSFIA